MANYAARFQKKDIGIYGAPKRIRTSGLCLWRAALYFSFITHTASQLAGGGLARKTLHRSI
jgi:hypothetical protein